jgi:streptogramin lyase
LSYRCEKTFGETEVAYPSDTAHINYPWGLATDGTNVWIGEYWGNRALQYTQTGSFEMQIGLSGYADIYDTVLLGITDIDVDNSGNIWIVDGDANHIVEFDPLGNKIGDLGTAGNWGTGDYQFGQPQSIAFDAAGNIYVSDGAPWYDLYLGNHRIQIFDNTGDYLASIGETEICGLENDRICGPRHITVDGNQLYISDAGNHRVQIFDISTPASPIYVATLGTPGESGDDNAHFNSPSGVAVDADYIYVADLWNSRVQVFDRNTLEYEATIGSGWGSDNDQFKSPSDVAIDASGNLYVADFVNTRVQQFNKTGDIWVYERTYGVTGVPYVTDWTHFNRPSGVSVSKDGYIYVTEDNGHRLIKLDADGELQWTVGAAGVKGDWDDSNNRLNNPADVALDSDGKIYVADRWHGRVQIYNPNGSYYATVGDLWCPGGVALSPTNYLYVADSCQNTVQIYDSNLVFVAMMGESGVSGSNNSHFNWPQDVVIDSTGMIYVADSSNQRVQVFNASRTFIRTMGVTELPGNRFDQFSSPSGLTVDTLDRLFVSDTGNDRIQVFDSEGAYLTTIGGTWGNQTGQVQAPGKVGVDTTGNVYIADWGNHRIQKFAPGVPDWKQVNINGFGNPNVQYIPSLEVFNDYLYAGSANWNEGAFHIYRSVNSKDWEQIEQEFDNGISSLIAFDGQLFAGTWSGSIWSSPDGLSWTQVMATSYGIASFTQFNDKLYAGTWSGDYCSGDGAEIWQTTDGTTWTPFVTGGNGDPNVCGVPSSTEFGEYLYFGIGDWSGITGGRVWRTDGINITEVVGDGFGDPENYAPGGLAAFRGWLYASIYNPESDQVWRSNSGDPGTWEMVLEIGLGEPGAKDRTGLIVHNNHLFLSAQNDQNGMQIWSTTNGQNWQQIGFEGFGDSNNFWSESSSSMVIFNDRLTIGTTNSANGGEIWQFIQNRIYLPLIKR